MNLNAALREVFADAQLGCGARKLEFPQLVDGCVRRRIMRRDVAVERNEVIPFARTGTGSSQSEFEGLTGVFVRPLRVWEARKREPSNATQTLLRIAVMHPRIVRAATA